MSNCPQISVSKSVSFSLPSRTIAFIRGFCGRNTSLLEEMCFEFLCDHHLKRHNKQRVEFICPQIWIYVFSRESISQAETYGLREVRWMSSHRITLNEMIKMPPILSVCRDWWGNPSFPSNVRSLGSFLDLLPSNQLPHIAIKSDPRTL